tara:strand:- start:560 stop:844 length:285 start_codon:yes stop_codon:yes gene_type:complete
MAYLGKLDKGGGSMTGSTKLKFEITRESRSGSARTPISPVHTLPISTSVSYIIHSDLAVEITDDIRVGKTNKSFTCAIWELSGSNEPSGGYYIY